MPSTYVHHTLDVYNVDLYATTSRRGWASIRRHVSVLDDLDHDSGGITQVWTHIPTGKPAATVAIVYVNPGQDPATFIDTCAHEATHVALELASRSGWAPEGEPFAYLVGWLTRWLWSNLWRQP